MSLLPPWTIGLDYADDFLGLLAPFLAGFGLLVFVFQLRDRWAHWVYFEGACMALRMMTVGVSHLFPLLSGCVCTVKTS